MKQFIWTTRRGVKLKLKDMTLSHIHNCLRFLTGSLVCDPRYLKMKHKDMVKHLRKIETHIRIFTKEFKRRLK